MVFAVLVYHCKHTGGPELSSWPQTYCVTRIVQDLVEVVAGLILKFASWQSRPFESTITEMKVFFSHLLPIFLHCYCIFVVYMENCLHYFM